MANGYEKSPDYGGPQPTLSVPINPLVRAPKNRTKDKKQ